MGGRQVRVTTTLQRVAARCVAALCPVTRCLDEHDRRGATGAGTARPEPSRAHAAGRRRCGRRHRVERDQHRHRAAVLFRPHAALPGHGLSAGSRLRVGGAHRRRRRQCRRSDRRARVRPRCPLLWRGARPVRRRGLPSRGAGVAGAADRRASWRAGRAAGARRHRLSRHPCRRRAPSRPDRRARRAGSPAGASGAAVGRAGGGVGAQSDAGRGRHALSCARSVRGHPQRLQRHLRRQRRSGDSGYADRASRAVRRDRARRFL